MFMAAKFTAGLLLDCIAVHNKLSTKSIFFLRLWGEAGVSWSIEKMKEFHDLSTLEHNRV